MTDRFRRGVACLAIAGLTLLGPLGSGAIQAKEMADDLRQTMLFAASMAQRGNWREARFRWERAALKRPDDPKLLNNLAVALEVLGDPEEALDYYRRAASASSGDPSIEDNLRRSAYFWSNATSRGELGDETGDDHAMDSAGAEGPGEPGAPRKIEEPLELASSVQARNGKRGKKKGKTLRVGVGLPVPPRLKLEGDEQILVTSFLSEDTNLLDTNRELVRFLRSEFRKNTEHGVPEINPPPAIPEQTVEDLLANHEFWKHLGRNYDAELIVSGVITYDREDVSTFRDVDTVSARTGQKVRRNRFVEQEEFQYALDIFFIDGATGTLRFRDRLKRTVIFQGLQNDPIAAFFALSESIATDVLAAVTERVRPDSRTIFKR